MNRKIIIPALISVAAAFPILGAQMASSQTAAPAVAAPMPAGWLGTEEIAVRLSAAGWTVLKLEAEPNDANYKACVVGAGGPQIETRVDPLTGAILSQEAKDCLGGDALMPANLNAFGGSSSDDSDDSSDDSEDSSDDSSSSDSDHSPDDSHSD